MTGTTYLNLELAPKMLELMRETIPAATSMVLLINPTNPTGETQRGVLQAAARTLGIELHVMLVSNPGELNAAFENTDKVPARVLADAGYCVFALTYGQNPDVPPPLDQRGGLLPMEQSAQELSGFIDGVLAATGAHKVNIVGHSEGATMPYYYVKFLGGAAKVDHYVGLAPGYHGTTVDGLAPVVSLLG